MTATSSDLYSALDSEYAPSLPRLSAGDKFSGEVIGIDSRTGEYSTYPILTIRLDRVDVAGHPDIEAGTPFSWHVLHSVAQQKLARMNVKPGETIAVGYLGMRDSRNGSGRYHDWAVASDRPAEPFNWGGFGTQGGDDEPPASPASDVPSDFNPSPPAPAGAATSAPDDDVIPF